MNRPSWHHNAPCAAVDGDEWFPEVGGRGERAKEICAACPYKAPCLIEAVERREQYGIWGGVLFRNFPKIRRELDLDDPSRLDGRECGPAHNIGGNQYVDPNGKTRCRSCNRERAGEPLEAVS